LLALLHRRSLGAADEKKSFIYETAANRGLRRS
jgi:hypothetical protein